MRKTLLILGVVASTLALSACGATTKATINQSVASLGAQSTVQVHLTATASGPGTAQAQAALKLVSLNLDYDNTAGGPISQGVNTLAEDITVNVGQKSLVEIREVDGNAYLNVDVTSLSAIPGVNLPAAQLAEVQLLFGGKWFEIPKNLVDSLAKKETNADKTKAAADVAIERQIIDDISKVIDNGHAKALAGGGYAETGTIASIVKAVWPTIASLTKTTLPPSAKSVKGTYTLTLTNSGSTATGASITITAPGDGSGISSIGLVAAITHNSDTITAPSNPTVITPALIKQLESSGASGAL